MAKDNLISQQDLVDWSGIKRKKELIDWLIQNGIQFYYVKNGEVVTTQAACDQPLLDKDSGPQAVRFL